MTFNEACRMVIDHCPNRYAKAYAQAGAGMNQEHEQKVQALYILNNMSHWRGDLAREVRTFLKEFSR